MNAICSPDPTARMPDWGGLMMAQNCLIPNGPPKLETVNVPPCKVNHPTSINHHEVIIHGPIKSIHTELRLPRNLGVSSCFLWLLRPIVWPLLLSLKGLSCQHPADITNTSSSKNLYIEPKATTVLSINRAWLTLTTGTKSPWSVCTATLTFTLWYLHGNKLTLVTLWDRQFWQQ